MKVCNEIEWIKSLSKRAKDDKIIVSPKESIRILDTIIGRENFKIYPSETQNEWRKWLEGLREARLAFVGQYEIWVK